MKLHLLVLEFSQSVLLIALITFCTYFFYLNQSFDETLKIAVSVIIIACPCALALATPIANIVGLSQAYLNGIIFKSGSYLETLAKINILCIDKTGTLTLGEPQLINEIKFSSYDPLILKAFLQKDLHPIAKGILTSLPNSPSPYIITSFEHIPSQGIRANSSEGELIGGRLEFLESLGIKIPNFSNHSGSLFAFAQNQKLQSIFFLQDELKPNAKELIQSLKEQKIQIIILSGDEENEVLRIAQKLEISNHYAKQTPTDKSSIIQSLQTQNQKVAMIGDGINDALALKNAEISITMANKSDLALQSSDIILLQDKLIGISKAIKIANKTYKTIRINILFSLLYNVFTIPLAILGYISPIFAALSMSLSSLIVVLNSLHIKNKVL